MKETEEKKEEKKFVINAQVIGIWLVMLAVIITLLWQMFALRAARNDLEKQEAEFASKMDEMKKQSAIVLAENLTTTFGTLLALDTTPTKDYIKNICDALARKGPIKTLIITDVEGRVVVTSDPSEEGFKTEMAKVTVSEAREGDMWVITRPIIQNNMRVGTLRIKVK
ncbi:MAG TPA: hypothetical protein VNK96_06235 [Fimbriimonadales bacterium]|nr:hypothetical protein [Fimbriimonadales bacterium]